MVVVPTLTGRDNAPSGTSGSSWRLQRFSGRGWRPRPQRYVSEAYLKVVADVVTGLGGLVYAPNCFLRLPFRV
jgi:hypothetical protein